MPGYRLPPTRRAPPAVGLDQIGFMGFITPQDVKNLIAKVDGDIATLQASVDTAPNLDPSTHHAWDEFAASWKSYDKEVSIIPILFISKYHDVTGFEEKARDWEPIIKVARGGSLAGPSILPEVGPLGGIAKAGGLGIGIGVLAALGIILLLKK